MIKIKIVSIGKTKESWLNEAIQEYLKRLTGTVSIEFVFWKDDAQLVSYVNEEEGVVCLDPEGEQLDSPQFAQSLAKHGSRITFVIGGSDGLPASLKQKFPLISLSKLTFTHQLTRLVLVEQIYRAYEILKGSKYHK